MDNKKIGEFISKMRKEKNLSQYDLAEQIHISRESISKWERGIGKPDKNCVQALSEIFGVSTDEIILGKKIENKAETKKLSLELYGNLNKSQKRLLICQVLIILIILIFFIYYFLNNYNSIHVYNINYSDEEVTINNGIITATKEKVYFYLGEVTANFEITNLKLYYKDKNNQEKLIYKTDKDSIVLYDYYGYNEYFDYDNLKYIFENIYLDVEFKDTNHIIKLNIVKDFSNDKVQYKKNNTITTNKDEIVNKINTTKIKEKFTEVDGSYIYNKNNIEITYLDEPKILNVKIKKDNNIKEEWNYYINQDMLSYTKYDKEEIKNSFDYSNNNYICLIDKCSNEKEKTDYFYELINDILT